MMFKTSKLASAISLSLTLLSSFHLGVNALDKYVQETLDTWTAEAQESAIEMFPLIDEEEQTTFIAMKAAGKHGLYKLVETDMGGATRRRKLSNGRNLEEMGLLSPEDGASFTDPRTIKFKATVDTSLTDLHFVFDDLGRDDEIPITVDADEIEDSVATERVGGFTSGNWAWIMQGKDASGNIVKTEPRTFHVDGVVSSAQDQANRRLQQAAVTMANWTSGTDGGRIQRVSGRIYYKEGTGTYACSGTAIKDYQSGRSLVLTASHCIYAANFSHTVVFIPNRDARTAGVSTTGIRACYDDPCGCWVASGSVIPDKWTSKKWPYNAVWDYGFYVIDDVGAHTGPQCNPATNALDTTVNAMDFVTDQPVVGQYIHALGYPGALDKNLMYCANSSRIEKAFYEPVNGAWYIDGCNLASGASGGPWVALMDPATHSTTGYGAIVGVNSWGYATKIGMAAAIIDESYAICMINHARTLDIVQMRARPNGFEGDFVSNTCIIAKTTINPRFLVTPPAPTAAPTTLAPTPPPTLAPTAPPTLPPTAPPTLPPTPPPTPPPTLPPTEPPTLTPTAAPTRPPVGTYGDPHFRTWTGDKFDYHGECDLVLIDNPFFNNSQGLKLYIRTKRVKYYSYIERIALQIGADTLEFANDVENFLINGEVVEPNHRYHKTLLGGFLVRRDKKAISVRLNGRQGQAQIRFHPRPKTGFPAVAVDTDGTDFMEGSIGLLGEWGTGRKLARDGQTLMMDSDIDAFAQEWQVRDTEPMLFKEARFPQYPTKCVPPEKMLGTRLGMALARQQAEKACAGWKVEDRDDCIFDVIATRNVEVAAEGGMYNVA